MTSALTVASSAATGYRDVAVNVGSKTVTCHNCLKVERGPSISSISPSSVKRSTTTTVTVSGQFGPRSTVAVSGTGVTVSKTTWVNYSTLTLVLVTSSSASTGTRSLTLTDATLRYGDGGRALCSGCLTVAAAG